MRKFFFLTMKAAIGKQFSDSRFVKGDDRLVSCGR